MELGRRERKKAATRAAIAATSLRLFLERGFDDVSVREIADAADVAVATVFAHFSGKEALVFDEDDARLRDLLAAVKDRDAGVDVWTSLERWFSVDHEADPLVGADLAAFRALVERTPALAAYWNDSWRRSAPALAAAIEATSDADARTALLAATLAIEGYLLSTHDPDPARARSVLFDVLREGLPQLSRA